MTAVSAYQPVPYHILLKDLTGDNMMKLSKQL